MDIKAVVTMEEIPNDLIVNWDQTGLNYVPVSQWMMAREGSKRVEVVGLNDKRQITGVFAGSLSGNFLPVQLVYQGKTTKCLPSVAFPEKWNITSIANHWCNEDTMLLYIKSYVEEKRKSLGLSSSHSALVIFDEFNGQTSDPVLRLLEENNIFCHQTAEIDCSHST